MVRGTNEKIFFVESNNIGDKIMMLEFNENQNFDVIAKEIYSIVNGRIVLFGIDCDSYKSTDSQAFYIVDDEQRIYHITNGIDGELEDFEVD